MLLYTHKVLSTVVSGAAFEYSSPDLYRELGRATTVVLQLRATRLDGASADVKPSLELSSDGKIWATGVNFSQGTLNAASTLDMVDATSGKFVVNRPFARLRIEVSVSASSCFVEAWLVGRGRKTSVPVEVQLAAPMERAASAPRGDRTRAHMRLEEPVRPTLGLPTPIAVTRDQRFRTTHPDRPVLDAENRWGDGAAAVTYGDDDWRAPPEIGIASPQAALTTAAISRAAILDALRTRGFDAALASALLDAFVTESGPARASGPEVLGGAFDGTGGRDWSEGLVIPGSAASSSVSGSGGVDDPFDWLLGQGDKSGVWGRSPSGQDDLGLGRWGLVSTEQQATAGGLTPAEKALEHLMWMLGPGGYPNYYGGDRGAPRYDHTRPDLNGRGSGRELPPGPSTIQPKRDQAPDASAPPGSSGLVARLTAGMRNIPLVSWKTRRSNVGPQVNPSRTEEPTRRPSDVYVEVSLNDAPSRRRHATTTRVSAVESSIRDLARPPGVGPRG